MHAPSPWLGRLSRAAPVAVALLVAAVLLPRVIPLAEIAALSPFGRDQGIFHYVGWSLLQGEVLYRDVRDVNGPLTGFVHAAFIWLGAEEETRFRTLELAVGALCAFVLGSALPGIASPRGSRTPRPSLGARVAWGAAAVAVLGAQYLHYDWWHSAQRESFADWFVMLALAAALHGLASFQGDELGDEQKRQRLALGLAGFFAAIPVFGKPTFLVAGAVIAAAALAERPSGLGRGGRFVWLTLGLGLGGGLLLAMLASFGDLEAFLRTSAHDVPAMYRFIWPQPLAWFFGANRRAHELWAGVGGSAVLLVLIGAKLMPGRALAIALLPLGAIGAMIAQRKGFDYHHHPITLAVRLQLLLLAVWAVESWSQEPRRILRYAAPALGALLALLGVAKHDLDHSPHAMHPEVAELFGAPEARQGEAYFARFPQWDFCPLDMRRAAAFLQANTPSDARVQTYGMDPYLLHLAKRRSATPYIYSYDLSPSAALRGGEDLQPNEAQREVILAIRERHEDDLLARLEAAPPAAFVLIDVSPTMGSRDAREDLETWCPRTAEWLDLRYDLGAQIGAFRIYLPNEKLAHQSKAAATPR